MLFRVVTVGGSGSIFKGLSPRSHGWEAKKIDFWTNEDFQIAFRRIFDCSIELSCSLRRRRNDMPRAKSQSKSRDTLSWLVSWNQTNLRHCKIILGPLFAWIILLPNHCKIGSHPARYIWNHLNQIRPHLLPSDATCKVQQRWCDTQRHTCFWNAKFARHASKPRSQRGLNPRPRAAGKAWGQI